MRKKFTPPYSLKAFTLSEVLITLVIIGVVAAITVPTLFSYYQEQAIKSSLEKNYSVLKQALERYYIDNGERLAPVGNEHFALKTPLKNYLTLMYDCGGGYDDSNTACVPNISAPGYSGNGQGLYKTYNNKKAINFYILMTVSSF